MTVAENLIMSVLKTGDHASLFRIKDEYLDVESEVALLKFVKDYFRDEGVLPTQKLVQDRFTELEVPEGTSGHYLKELKERYIYTKLATDVPAIMRGLKKNPLEGLSKLRSSVANVDSDSSIKDTSYSENAKDRLLSYHERIAVKGITYISTGSDLLDSIIYGYRKNDLITIGGRSGMKKSWLMCLLAILCEQRLPDDLGPILFVTNEMSDEEIAERMDCIRFKLSYERFMKGELEDAEMSRYKKGISMLPHKNIRINILFNCETLDELRYKISAYRPSIVFVDGSYLMEPRMEEGMAKTTFITRNLKSIAKNLKVPIVNSTQLRKKTGRDTSKMFLDGQDEFYYGSYIQDSDFALRAFQTPEMVYAQKIGLEFVKSRRSAATTIEWVANLETMYFEFLEPSAKISYTDEEPLDI